MKTKKGYFGKPFLSKRLVVIVIALCSVLLVALPTIAAEDDFVLGVYGNANEDDTIDMRDLTYVKLIFFGEKQETEFADAKYDGELNPLDFVQIKLVIVGKEKELTLVDSTDRIVTVKKPVERIISLTTYAIEPLRTLNAADKIVGVTDYTKKAPKIYMGKLWELPSVGKIPPDYEVLLSIDPDLVIMCVGSYYDATVDKIESADPNIAIVRFGFWGASQSEGMDAGIKDMRKLGYILDREDEAEAYIDWCYSGIIDSIKARTEKLSDDEKPRVLFGDFKEGGAHEWFTYGKNSAVNDRLEIVGARNIAADIDLGGKPWSYVDFEWVIEQDPVIIIRYYLTYPEGVMSVWGNYGVDDMAEIIAKREEVLSCPVFANVAAVKNEKVQMIAVAICGGYGSDAIGIAYYAKFFHPVLFEDLDPQAIHQEFLTRFQRIDYDVCEHGVFVYPEPS